MSMLFQSLCNNFSFLIVLKGINNMILAKVKLHCYLGSDSPRGSAPVRIRMQGRASSSR